RRLAVLLDVGGRLGSAELMTRPLQFTLGIALSPLEQLGELARTAEECGYTSIALPDSLVYMKSAAAKSPYTADRPRLRGPAHPAALLHQCPQAGLAQSAAAGQAGRLGGEPDEQPLRLRCRDRLGAGGIRVVRAALRPSRRPGRRDDRGHQAGARRRHGRIPRR